jgi:hypothetical protein
MPLEFKKVDTFQTRFMQSFVNLTKYNSTQYPATSVIKIGQYDASNAFSDVGTITNALTTIYMYDQWALRVASNTAPLSGFIA